MSQSLFDELQGILDSIPAMIFYKDTENRFLRVNRAFADVMNLSKEELEGRSLFDIYPREQAEAYWQDDKEVMSSGEPKRNIIERMQTKKGDILWVKTDKILYRDEQGQIIGVIGFRLDITQSRIAEEALLRLSRAVEQSPATVIITDINGDIQYVNPKFCQLTGYSPEEAIGKNPRFLKSNVQPPEVYKELWETIINGREWRGEFCNKKKDGTLYWEFASVSPIRDHNGKTVSYLAVKEDITARKLFEEQLKTRNFELEIIRRELERSNRDLEQFAYVASHDLQEPLRMVISYTQLLQKKYINQLDKDAGDFINNAVNGGVRMQALINDLLRYSRVNSKSKSFEQVQMSGVCADAVENLKVAIQESGAEIFYDSLPQVNGDPVQLTQLMQNFIGNAIKFCPKERTPKIHIRVEEHADEWVFSVQDNGIGIEPEFRDKIFEIFQRLHPKEEYPGTGIGLAICKKIVERYGGRIWVESEPGKGTTFYFTIKRN